MIIVYAIKLLVLEKMFFNRRKKILYIITKLQNPDTPIVVYQNTFAFNKRPVSSNSAMTETTVSDAPSGTIQSNGPTSDDNNRFNILRN